MADKPYSEQPDLHTKAPHRAALLTYPGNLREALRQAQEDSTKTLLGVAQGIPSVFLTKVSLNEHGYPRDTGNTSYSHIETRSWHPQSPTLSG
jgi:hypothetical protein